MSDCILSEPFHEDAIEFGLVEVERFWFGEVLEEVVYALIVDLQEGAVDAKGVSFLLLVVADILK